MKAPWGTGLGSLVVDGTKISYILGGAMTGAELLRKITRLGRARGVAVSFDQRHGKGSHATLHYGSQRRR